MMGLAMALATADMAVMMPARRGLLSRHGSSPRSRLSGWRGVSGDFNQILGLALAELALEFL